MKFVPNASHATEMLEEMGLSSIDELFSDIPSKMQCKKLNLPESMSEMEVQRYFKEIGEKNRSTDEMLSFLGGGVKHHFIPAVVPALVGRSEFYTAYTPYQPEISQGFLQAMFEYQSLIANLMGLDVSNASLYDGETAIGEAALMSARITKKQVFVMPEAVTMQKKKIVESYTHGAGITIREVPFDLKTGQIDVESLHEAIDDDVCGVYVENPNFFGCFEEEIPKISKMLEQKDALFILGVDPLSLGLVKNPGELGADIAVGEGRCFGNPMDFGGSSLGLFACKKKYLRQIPGRIIGMTQDDKQKRAFCMTMQTREQHIRRGRATSNICTNQGLCALTAAIHLSWLGGEGLKEIAYMNYKRGKQAKKRLTEVNGVESRFSSDTFNEFVLKIDNADQIYQRCLKKKIHPGLLMGHKSEENLKECMLCGVSELHTEEDIERFATILEEVL